MKRLVLGVLFFLVIIILGLVLSAVQVAAAPQAVITVDSTADIVTSGDNQCTLREAIDNANGDSDTTGGDCTAGSGADVVVLAAEVYTLTISGADEDGNAGGDLDVLDDLTIDGAGSAVTVIDGNGLDRVLHVVGAYSLSVNDLLLSGGYVDGALGGGGILNDGGVLMVTDSLVVSNVTAGTGYGGGIYNHNGQATLNNTAVFNNRVETLLVYGGGGVANGPFGSTASLTLTNSQVVSNSAPAGGGLYSSSDSLTVIDSIVESNLASAVPGGAGGAGGGIHARGEVTIRRTTLTGNHAQASEAFYGDGGGAFFLSANVLIEASTIMSNSLSTVYDFGAGGGVLFLDSAAIVVNSTFSGNSAVGNPAATFSGVGGGIFVGGQFNPANVTFINTTIANNSSNVVGGGVASGNIGPSVTVSFVNTLVAGNAAPADMNCGRLSADNWLSLGHNLEEDDNCLFDQPTDQVNTDPLLGPLQDNGGPTWTHALLDLSPAIDAGDDGVCGAAPVNGVDQRGVVRPIGPHCDTGAYESSAVPPVITRFVYLPVVTR